MHLLLSNSSNFSIWRPTPLVHRALLLLFTYLLFSPLQLAGQNSLDRKIDFSIQQQTIPDALWQLSEEAQIEIAFSNNHFTEKKYSFTFQQKPLSYILEKMLTETRTSYSVTGKQVIVFKKPSKKITLSGYVEDKESGERLIGANIYDSYSGKGTSSNEYGFFSLTILNGKHNLRVSYLGYNAYELEFETEKSRHFQVELKNSLMLSEIIITGEDSLNQNGRLLGDDNSINKGIENLPTLGGEVDILRVLQQLPGVQSGTDGFGGLHVRGGNADQNLILLDGVPIYNPYHALGMYSIFDHKIVRKVRYFRGHFPARYGGRISSVVDVRTKEGNSKDIHAEASTGLIASKMSIEGPLVRDKVSFFVSARRSHLDPFLKKYSKKSRKKDDETGFYNYYFGEVLAKINYKASQRNKFYLSFYKGKDDYHNEKNFSFDFDDFKYDNTENQNLQWGNTLGVYRWNHQFSQKVFSNLTATFSQFEFNSDEKFNQSYFNPVDQGSFSTQTAYRSKSENASVKLDFDYFPNPKHYIKTGITVSRHSFTPGIFTSEDSLFFDFETALPDSLVNPRQTKALELNVYLEDEWTLSDGLQVQAGLFASSFMVDEKNYLQFDPRISFNWQIAKPLRFTFSVNKMNQYLHLLTRSDSGFPNDLWVSSTGKVRPQQAWILDTGLDWQISPDWSVSTNVYYKKMNNLINYSEDANFRSSADGINARDWEDNVAVGKGSSKGVELLIKREALKSSGWISYTLSKSDRQFDAINDGETFPFRFDLRHMLNIVFSYQLNDNWNFSSTWNYSSGSKISLPLRNWQYLRQNRLLDFYYLDFGKKNAYQLPANHRMDVSMKYHKIKSWGSWTFNFGVYNVYNRRNIYYIKPGFSPETGTEGYKSVSFIPVLPYFSFSVAL